MIVATKRKPSLLEIARAAASVKRKYKSWLDDLKPHQREEILQIARMCVTEGTPQAPIVRALKDVGIDVTINKMRDLVERVRRGDL